eukprot:scaffold6030_cov199-Amphora_coffeaeformis.AAC.8
MSFKLQPLPPTFGRQCVNETGRWTENGEQGQLAVCIIRCEFPSPKNGSLRSVKKTSTGVKP